jgi:DNA repair and recombination RAD54-like protein
MRKSVILAALQPKAEGEGRASPAPKNGADWARSVTGGGFGPLLGRKPFKAPLPAGRRSAKGAAAEDLSGGRKRKRVNYTGMGGGEDDGDGDAAESSDAEEAVAKKPKGKPGVFGKDGKMTSLEGVYKGIDARGVSLNVDNRKWQVFKPKDGAIKRRFNVPVMRAKDGAIIETRMSGASLGTRKPIEIPPRPLHDPMGEHAIVLFDPTVDDVEAEREKERLRRERLAADALAKAEGGVEPEKPAGPTPHKSLAELLGLRSKDDKKKVVEKVPVVIDPRLGKVLRPHQVEGVKVSHARGVLRRRQRRAPADAVRQFLYRCATSLMDEHAQG